VRDALFDPMDSLRTGKIDATTATTIAADARKAITARSKS